MPPIRVSARAKINLHLEVLGLRSDGFHELAMVMQSIDLADQLSLETTADGLLQLSCDRPDLSTGSDNLVLKAAERLRQHVGMPELGARLHLEKRIPVGAGLAGGSADGAAALVGLNALWNLGVPASELQALAASLGSDMPFCLDGGTQLCFGRGEVLEPALGDNPTGMALAVLLVKHPASSVSTPWAYGRCREMRSDFYLDNEADFEQRRQALRQGPLLAALATAGPLPPLRNDLQAVVAPEVASVREGLALLQRSTDALAVAMSGSGPSLFALFPDLARAEAAQAALASDLAAGGFESWCCRCCPAGLQLEPGPLRN